MRPVAAWLDPIVTINRRRGRSRRLQWRKVRQLARAEGRTPPRWEDQWDRRQHRPDKAGQ
jgi:hypothetical protein